MKTNAQLVSDAKSYGRVFRSSSSISDQFKQLAKDCHPDTGGSVEAFSKLAQFRKEAEEARSSGIWEEGNTLFYRSGTILGCLNGIQAIHKFELGTVYVFPTQIVYVLDREAPHESVSSFKSSKIESIFKPLMPHLTERKSIGSKTMYFYSKTPDQFLLADVIQEDWKEEHVAWFMSRLFDLGCFFKYSSGVIPLDLSACNLLVSIQHHSISFVGNFWFAYKQDSKISLLPNRILKELPERIRNSKIVEWSIYSSQAKALCRELLGDRSGSKLRGCIREPFFNWLMSPGSDHQQEEYEMWQKSILPSIFPVREFVKWPINAADIYEEIL